MFPRDSFFVDRGSKAGVLVIHGFTGSPANIRFLGEKIADAGFTVTGPLLTGHGRTWQDLNRSSHLDWVRNVEEAYQDLKARCSHVFVGGLSMGGALALYLAEYHPEIKGIFAINHALYLNRDWRHRLVPLACHFIPSVDSGRSDVKDPSVETGAYPRIPLKALHQLMELMKKVRAGLSRIHQPILIFKSREDHVIPIKSAVHTLERVSSIQKRIVWLDNSYHVATMDFDRYIIAEETIRFLRGL